MKTDTYTKIILTVIAVNLTVITLKPLISPDTANAAVITKQAFNNQAYGLVPVNKDGSINVKMNTDGPLEVKLVGIDHALYLNWDAIKVKSDN
jgi:hypothetical protein